jgi:porphobilinogen synthase
MVRETRLHTSQLVEPFFVMPGEGVKQPVESMPGIHRFSVDRLVDECGAGQEAGVGAVLLFGIPEEKDGVGSEGYSEEGVVCQALRELKKTLPDLFLIADVCLCEYTDHGHCGVLEGEDILNDPTLDLLCRASVAYAEAGADMVAPSAMADGQVRAIREALDRHGFESTPVMSYSAKYASAFYGPFRDAADSTPQFGDRSGYQMDPANAREALREVELDIEEGADIVMVKPALAYLDVLRSVAATSPIPVAAYNVSGEYSMVMAAAERGWVDGARLALEILTSIHRAGADIVITYHAREVARMLKAE